MNSNTISPDSVMPRRRWEAMLKKIIWYDDSKKILSTEKGAPPIFVWLNQEALLKALILVYNTRGIDEIQVWEKIIQEWEEDCDTFFLLLKWRLGIYKGNKCIANIDELSVVWEMWFVWESRRTATVMAKNP